MAEESVTEKRSLQRPKRQRQMTAKRKAAMSQVEEDAQNRQTFIDFFNFCNVVLAYEEKLSSPPEDHLHGFLDSMGGSSHSSSDSSSDSSDDTIEDPSSITSTASSDSKESNEMVYTSEDEEWNLVTCFCRRPFAGRPMIECSECGTWIHMFCANIPKDQVPEIYICPSCQVSANQAKGSQAKKPRLT
ncbi:PHD finger protein 23-like isoform X2 [Halichondria panicea]|uniref:PHD finger protein 23-like isoform X2 n=1 Tax=Halichondria panicea TaxID=6063 RepID=UPI00312B3157